LKTLRAGVIAAGRGERLRGSADLLKPLVRVGGRTLIERVLGSMAEAGAREVVVIINEDSLAVRDHVSEMAWPFALRWIVETTPSSMHSFLRVVETLAADEDNGPFLVSTVDTVAPSGAYRDFVAAATRHPNAAIALAVAPAADDEKPLFVRASGSEILAIGDAAAPAEYATAGYYAVRSAVLREADAARHDGLTALRLFLARLLARGYSMAAIPVPRSIDVDRPIDVGAAEAFVKRVSP
jgi:NDP-sugar pyrophosphorylase family protein